MPLHAKSKAPEKLFFFINCPMSDKVLTGVAITTGPSSANTSSMLLVCCILFELYSFSELLEKIRTFFYFAIKHGPELCPMNLLLLFLHHKMTFVKYTSWIINHYYLAHLLNQDQLNHQSRQRVDCR